MTEKLKTREKLLSVAKELFCSKGYHAVGTQEICQSAGVLKGTLYHFFATKLDLALAVLEQFATMTRDEYAAVSTGRGSPARRLIRVFELDREMLSRQKKQNGHVLGCLFGNFVLELSAVEPRAKEMVNQIIEEWSKAITPLIEDLISSGEIPTCDPQIAARAVIALLQGAVLVAKATNDPDYVVNAGRNSVRMLGGTKIMPMP